jgi:hypothetical protein
MFRTLLCNVVAAACVMLGAHGALAENRIALVIGQSAYRTVTPLPNPANDARAIAQLLGDAGFEVQSASDLTQNALRDAVGAFAANLATKGPDTVALVFYAGHGLQIDGENYLVPVDIDPKRETDIPLQAVRLNDVLNTLTAVPSKSRIILLDACRNNPFPDINKTAGRGLALVDARIGAAGTLLSFSTSPGAEAEDGNGANSPYTTALQAGPAVGQSCYPGTADAVGEFVAGKRFQPVRYRRRRRENLGRQAQRRTMAAGVEGQAGRGCQRPDRLRRQRRGL